MEVMLSLTAVQLCRCHLLCRSSSSTPYSSLPKPSPISPFLGCLLTNCVALLCQYCKLSRGPPSAQKPGLFDANKVSWPAIGFCLLSMMLSLGKKLVKPGFGHKGTHKYHPTVWRVFVAYSSNSVAYCAKWMSLSPPLWWHFPIGPPLSWRVFVAVFLYAAQRHKSIIALQKARVSLFARASLESLDKVYGV